MVKGTESTPAKTDRDSGGKDTDKATDKGILVGRAGLAQKQLREDAGRICRYLVSIGNDESPRGEGEREMENDGKIEENGEEGKETGGNGRNPLWIPLCLSVGLDWRDTRPETLEQALLGLPEVRGLAEITAVQMADPKRASDPVIL